jgi:hypothetical protein
MASMTSAMTRNLQRFVEYDLAGCVRWDQCKVIVPKDGGGDIVTISFEVAGHRHTVEIESSDYDPHQSLGLVLLDGIPQGPIDERTWTRVALVLKAELLKREIA